MHMHGTYLPTYMHGTYLPTYLSMIEFQAQYPVPCTLYPVPCTLVLPPSPDARPCSEVAGEEGGQVTGAQPRLLSRHISGCGLAGDRHGQGGLRAFEGVVASCHVCSGRL